MDTGNFELWWSLGVRGHDPMLTFVADDVYTIMNRFAPGFQAPKHLHLGEVHGFTLEGRWGYREYDWLAGSARRLQPDAYNFV